MLESKRQDQKNKPKSKTSLRAMKTTMALGPFLWPEKW